MVHKATRGHAETHTYWGMFPERDFDADPSPSESDDEAPAVQKHKHCWLLPCDARSLFNFK